MKKLIALFILLAVAASYSTCTNACGNGVCNSGDGYAVCMAIGCPPPPIPGCNETIASCPQDCHPPCTNQCSSGQVQCNGNSVQTCALSGSCWIWSNSTCSSGYTCSGGTCVLSCSNYCSYSGQTQCSGTQLMTCGNYDADPCLEWSAASNCPSGQTCSGGSCVASCSNECSSGQIGCTSSAQKWYCGEANDGDTCLDKIYQYCNSGYNCLSGNCVLGCTDECSSGQTGCSSGTQRWYCGNNDADSCLDKIYSNCASGQACSGGSCIATCTNQCTSGTRQCSGNNVQTCGDLNTDGCTEWITTQTCSGTQTCSAGNCILPPTTGCTCNSCDDCTTKLNSPSCTVVTMASNIALSCSGNPGAASAACKCVGQPSYAVAGLMNGKTFNCSGHTISGPGQAYGSEAIALSYNYNMLVTNCTIQNFQYGIDMFSASNERILGTVIHDTGIGMNVWNTSNNISGITLYNNQVGISTAGQSTNNRISNAVAYSNTQDGIQLGGTGNTVTGLVAYNNGQSGLHLVSASGNSFSNIKSYSSTYGVVVDTGSSNTFSNMNVSGNSYGMVLYGATGNSISTTYACGNSVSGFAFNNNAANAASTGNTGSGNNGSITGSSNPGFSAAPCGGAPVCTNQCSSGQSQCSGTQLQTCFMNASGCLVWGTATSCASGQTCSGGSCVPSVAPTCALSWSPNPINRALYGQSQSGNWIPVNSTLSWALSAGSIVNGASGSAVYTCTGSKMIIGYPNSSGGSTIYPFSKDGQCSESCTLSVSNSAGQSGSCSATLNFSDCSIPTCNNACTSGQTTCSGAQQQTCIQNSTGCYVWGTPTNCPSGQTCSGTACIASVSNCSSNVQFDKSFSSSFGTASVYLFDAHQTSDGGYIAGGFAGPTSGPLDHAVLLKTDASGNKEWMRSDFASDSLSSLINSVLQTPGGGYVFAGSLNYYGGDEKIASPDGFPDGGGSAWLGKTDASGNLQWNKTYSGPLAASVASVSMTSDGGYILAGYSSQGATMIKTGANGNQQWIQYFGSSSAFFSSVQQTTDGGYILSGGNGNSDSWLLKTDANGNQQWSKTFGTAGNAVIETAFSVQQTSDGGYIAAGASRPNGDHSSALVIKTNSNGNLQWNKTYKFNSYSDLAFSIRQTSDGGYIVAGSSEFDACGSEGAVVLKTDSAGNAQWNRTYYSNFQPCGAAHYHQLYSIEATPDGGYIGAGAGDFKGWLLKLGCSALPTCAPQCSAGQTQCSGTQQQSCIQNASGCNVWGNPVNCPSGQTCSGTSCAIAGKPSCNLTQNADFTNPGTWIYSWSSLSATSASYACTGQLALSGPAGLSGQRSLNFSPAKSFTENCTYTFVNSIGSSDCVAILNVVPVCTNQCSAGQKQCAQTGNAVQSCMYNSSSGCYVWNSSSVTCPLGQLCSNGACVNSVCPNGVCEQFENCQVCPQDCGVCGVCGDGVCNTNENCNTCQNDCGICPPLFSLSFVYPTPSSGISIMNRWALVNVSGSRAMNYITLDFAPAGSSINYTSMLSGTSYSRNMTGLLPGLYTYSAYGCDVFNNCSSTERRNLTVIGDNKPPSVVLLNPIQDYNSPNPSVTFGFITTDDQAPVMDCTMSIDGSAWWHNSSVINNTPTYFTFSNISLNADHYWNVTCSDAGGCACGG